MNITHEAQALLNCSIKIERATTKVHLLLHTLVNRNSIKGKLFHPYSHVFP